MSVIVKGFTFTNGVLDQVTNSALHTLVDGATVTAIAMSEFSTSAHVIQVSATQPGSDQGDGSLWYDTTLGLLRTKNNNAYWDCPYVGPEMTNPGATIPKGSWVVVNGERTISMCATARWPDVLGVAVSTAVSGAKTLVAQKGEFPALVVGPLTIGDVVISAGHAFFAFADGYAQSIKATTSGSTLATFGIAAGIVLGSCASGITGLRNVNIWK